MYLRVTTLETIIEALGSSLGNLTRVNELAGRVKQWQLWGARDVEFKVWECVETTPGKCCWNGWTQQDRQYVYEALDDAGGLKLEMETAEPEMDRQVNDGLDPRSREKTLEGRWKKMKTLSMSGPCPSYP